MHPGSGIVFVLFAVLALGSACAPAGGGPAEPALASDQDKAFYALGLILAENIKVFSLTPDEAERVVLGLRDGANGNPARVENRERFGPIIQRLQQERSQASAQDEQTGAGAYLAAMAAEEGADKRESGVIYRETQAGTGANPAATSTVKVNYHGTLRDGSVFDSSVARGEPATFPLNRVVPCWQEAIQLMKVGGKAKITCPPELAYGDRGSGLIPAGAAITFEVELLEITAP